MMGYIFDFCTMILNLLCTFLLAGLYVVGWPVGIVGLIMSAGLFCMSGLYADAILQIVLHMAGIVGILILVIKKLLCIILSITGWLKVLGSIELGLLVSQLLIIYTDSTALYMGLYKFSISYMYVFGK